MIAVASALLAIVTARIPLLETMEWKVYDLQIRQAADPRRASPEIVLVEIDDISIQRMAENDMGRWPWPRDTHAVLLDYLDRARPKVVAFDVLFLEEDKNQVGAMTGAEADRALVESTRRLGRVVHAAEVSDTRDFAPPSGSSPRFALPGTIEAHRSVQLPFAALAESSRMIGSTFTVLDADGPVRRAVPFVRQGQTFYPSLPVAAAMVAMNVEASNVSLDAGTLRIGSRQIPLIDVRQEYVEVVRAQHMLVPYMTAPFTSGERTEKSYRSFRFWDLFLSELQLREDRPPEVDPAAFRDKIVIVGTTAAALHDLFQTPFGEAGKMPGMQVHASVIDGILNGAFVRPASPLMSMLPVVGACAIVATVAVFLGVWWSIAALAIAGALATGLSVRAFAAGTWVPLVPLVSGLVLAEFGSVTYKYFVEDRAKRQVRALFSRYVSPEVVRALIADPARARLGGERREMTVLFADIRGFTTMSEAGTPEDVLLQLNEFFTRMVEVLFRHRGTLDKFVGDMVMALFGAPVRDEEHADHAVLAALEMIRELEALNREWKARGKPVLDIGIGINTGEMIVGNVGSERTLSYTVIGDNVNLGARLESLNKEYGTHIIVSEFTLAQLKGSYFARPLGSVRVKGKTREVGIHEICTSAGELRHRMSEKSSEA